MPLRGRCALTLVLLAAGCTPAQRVSAPPAGDAPIAAAPIGLQPAVHQGAWYVGVLGQRGEPECPGGVQRWVDVEPMIGWTPTNALADSELQWLDHPVVAHGQPGPLPEPRVKTTVVAPCPTPQMRSDWVFTPRGLRIVRAGGSPSAYFARDSLRGLVELTASASAEQLIIDFRNPLPVALSEVTIRVHYEGCRGKPGTTSREHVVGSLAVGAGVRASFGRLFEDDRPPDARAAATHRAQSVSIVAQGVDATFDLDVPLAVLGAAVACPDRG